MLGGIYAFKSGLDMRAEIKMHGESLKQLGSSFQNEVQPIVVEIEGRTLELKGSAEQQYAEWRRLLRELYENETGLPATTAAAGRRKRARQPALNVRNDDPAARRRAGHRCALRVDASAALRQRRRVSCPGWRAIAITGREVVLKRSSPATAR